LRAQSPQACQKQSGIPSAVGFDAFLRALIW